MIFILLAKPINTLKSPFCTKTIFPNQKQSNNYTFIIIVKIPELMEKDDFYDKLPYTLPAEQANPEYVIFGTGLQECLIAAYKTKIQSKIGLIIDLQKTYGSSLKTVTFKQLHQLNTHSSYQKMYQFITPSSFLQTNQEYYDWCIANNKYRGFSIDIEPNFFFASSITCQCLKQADMDKYMDFHLVNNILHIHNNTFAHVPLSKGKIYQSKELSLIEKKTLLMSIHKLIKIYHRWMKLEEDINSTKQFDKGFGQIEEDVYKDFEARLDQHFLPFLTKLVKNNKKIINYFTYIICNYQYSYEHPLPSFAVSTYTLKSFINKFGKFIKSCGIYGEIPYLYVDNGIGDIPQAFSRIASIYGSTYILHPKVTIDSIQENGEEIQIHTNLSPGIPIKTKKIYYGPTYLDLKQANEEFDEQQTLRVFILCQKSGKQESSPSICFVDDIKQFTNPVYLFTFDGSTQSCPNNLIIYQFQTVLNPSQIVEEKTEPFVRLLSSILGQGFKESIKYLSTYVRTRRYPKQTQNSQKQWSLHDTKGIDLDQHFNNFIQIVGQQEHYFKKDTKNQHEEEEPFGGYETNYLLQKLDEINLKEQPIQAQQTISQPKGQDTPVDSIQNKQEQAKNEEVPKQIKVHSTQQLQISKKEEIQQIGLRNQ